MTESTDTTTAARRLERELRGELHREGDRIFVAACDRAGVERGVEWTAGTAIVDVDGWVVSHTRAELDLEAAGHIFVSRV